MAKRTINFRFSEEAHARLVELAKEREQTRTQVLEDLILGRPPSFLRDPSDWRMVVAQPSSAKQASGGVTSEKPVHSARASAESEVERARVVVGKLHPTSRTITGRPHGPVPKGKK